VRRYTVNTDLTEGNEEFTCICAKFSKDGILCSHILKIIIEKEISMIPKKDIIDRCRKKSMKIHVQREQEETLATSALLRYNVLSRKSTILNSKGLQNEIAMEYLMAQFNKLDMNLDILLATEQIGEGENQEQGNEYGQSIVAAQYKEDTEIEIEEPERIKRKGRPPKPKRFRTVVEDIKKKLVEQEKKKMAAEQKKKVATERKMAAAERKKKINQDTDSIGKII
jgi:hypothetical protein